MTKQQAIKLVREHFDETVLTTQTTDAFVKLFEIIDGTQQHKTTA